MHLFQFKYLVYLLLNLAACFFLFASVMGIPGNPDETNSKQKFILNLWGKLLTVGFKGIPILTGMAFLAFLFHYEETGKIFSYLNFAFGGSLMILVIMYYKDVK